MSKTVSDKLWVHLLSQSVLGIPDKNSVIFDVLEEHGIILATADNKAIWSATINSRSGWSHSFIFMKVVPSLIWENDDRPEAFHGTVTINATSDLAATADKQEAITATSNPTAQAVQLMQNVPSRISSTESIHVDSLDALFNIFGLDNTLSPATEDQIVMESVKPITVDQVDKPVISGPNGFMQPSGEHFIQWLKDAILNKKLIINDAHALVHIVSDTLYVVTPGIFNRYAGVSRCREICQGRRCSAVSLDTKAF